jgi:hypothetical protein
MVTKAKMTKVNTTTLMMVTVDAASNMGLRAN